MMDTVARIHTTVASSRLSRNGRARLMAELILTSASVVVLRVRARSRNAGTWVLR
jgi:hypothetical protein